MRQIVSEHREGCLHPRLCEGKRSHMASDRARGNEKHCREFVDRRMDEEERENLITEFSGGDAPRGHTRTHPEHDG